jgi:hypothetical protein
VGEVGAARDHGSTHWQGWHANYDDPGSSQSRRLEVVRTELGPALDDAAHGPIRLLSLCAGDGRDVVGVLAVHARGRDVAATLVELDPGLAERARRDAAGAGIAAIEVLEADAGCLTSYLDASSVFDVVLCCGVFGNITDADIRQTIFGLSTIVVQSGSVLWTRHRRAPDITPKIRSWFDDAGFEEQALVAISGTLATVGRERLRSRSRSSHRPEWLFHFVGDGHGALC